MVRTYWFFADFLRGHRHPRPATLRTVRLRRSLSSPRMLLPKCTGLRSLGQRVAPGRYFGCMSDTDGEQAEAAEYDVTMDWLRLIEAYEAGRG